MPNHVKNILTFEGEQQQIDALFNHVKTAASAFDFNTLIPMPKTLDIPSGTVTNLGIEAFSFRETGMIKPARGGGRISQLDFRRMQERPDVSRDAFIDLLVERGLCDINLGQVALDNLRDYGFPTWYEWRCEKWETKWNAYSIECEANKITFETAWAAPVPVIDVLAERFPNLAIAHCWADEDPGNNCGNVVYCGSEKKVTAITNGSNLAYEMYITCWGQSNCLEKDIEGNWHHKSCDGCNGCD